MNKTVISLALLLLVSTAVEAANVHFKGFTQIWFSYGDTEINDASTYGFSFKRVHFIPYGSFGRNITWMIHVGYEGHPDVKLYDAYLDFKISKAFRLTIGQFPVPGAPFRPSYKLDFVQRAAITQTWGGASGLFGWRALGFRAHGDILKGKIYYALMISNPKTLGGFFSPGNRAPTYTNTTEGINFWGRLEARPLKGLKAGMFLGSGELSNIEDGTGHKTDSYGFSLEYRQKGFYLKGEYLSGKKDETKYSGLYATLGYRIKKFEPILRYDTLTPGDGEPDAAGIERYSNITLGVNYYLNRNVKFQVNYVSRSETGTELSNNLFYINFQWFFNTK
jgi:hypothetical protein